MRRLKVDQKKKWSNLKYTKPKEEMKQLKECQKKGRKRLKYTKRKGEAKMTKSASKECFCGRCDRAFWLIIVLIAIVSSVYFSAIAYK